MRPMLASAVADITQLTYPLYASPKLDGCFSGNAQVWTEKGMVKIKDIVESRLKVKVASYNMDTKKVEFKKILNWYDNGDKEPQNWLNWIGSSSCITKNHKIYDAEREEWVEAGSFKGETISIDSRLNEALTGMLLGDSICAIEKRGQSGWRISWTVATKDLEYGEHKMKLMQGLFDNPIRKKDKISGYGSEVTYYVTPACTNLPTTVCRDLYQYDRSVEDYGKRKVDLNANDLRHFGDLSLAIWYFDDGSLSSNNGNSLTPRLIFSVPRYSDKTRHQFEKMFKRLYNVTPTFTKNGKDVSMVFSTPDSWYLLARINAVAGGVMPRKIPKCFDRKIVWEPLERISKSNLSDFKIYLSEYTRQHSKVAYDIEVEDNHNYFCDGILVHNCRGLVINGIVTSRSLKPIPNKYVQELFGNEHFNGLDGELIVGNPCDNSTFNTTTSVVMSRDKNPEEYGGVVFYVFDKFTNSEDEYLQRYSDLLAHLEVNGNDKMQVLQHTLVESPERLLELHTQYVAQGWEGTMTRLPTGSYKHGRSTLKQQWLLKLKDFEDAEGIVVDMVELMHNENESVTNALGRSERSTKKEGKRPAGMMGTLVIQTQWNGKNVQLELGTGFSEQDRKDMWNNKSEWIGKMVKYKFQKHGSMDKPRLPVYIGVRDEIDMS